MRASARGLPVAGAAPARVKTVVSRTILLWPRLEGDQADPIPARMDGSVPNTFPGSGAFSAFANVTMETFDQKAVQLGCMSCHNRARMTTDFMWSVFDHAYPPRLAPAPRQ